MAGLTAFPGFRRRLAAFGACRALNSAHRFLWAAPIRFLAARLSLGRGWAGAWATARFLGSGPSRLRTCVIC